MSIKSDISCKCCNALCSLTTETNKSKQSCHSNCHFLLAIPRQANCYQWILKCPPYRNKAMCWALSVWAWRAILKCKEPLGDGSGWQREVIGAGLYRFPDSSLTSLSSGVLRKQCVSPAMPLDSLCGNGRSSLKGKAKTKRLSPRCFCQVFVWVKTTQKQLVYYSVY